LKILQYHIERGLALAVSEGDDRIAPIEFDGDMVDFIMAPPSRIIKRDSLGLDEVRLAPAVSRPSKIIALGLNYADHVRESKGAMPKSPLVFAKFSTSLIGQKVRYR
jgi:2-keto-4-pentenoate hydratase/2-oxohepta-3-ene-1,7-dioic acid hydratase in catechol pathway